MDANVRVIKYKLIQSSPGWYRLDSPLSAPRRNTLIQWRRFLRAVKRVPSSYWTPILRILPSAIFLKFWNKAPLKKPRFLIRSPRRKLGGGGGWPEGKCPLERARRRWEDNIEIDLWEVRTGSICLDLNITGSRTPVLVFLKYQMLPEDGLWKAETCFDLQCNCMIFKFLIILTE
jgi:hypothetical protein